VSYVTSGRVERTPEEQSPSSSRSTGWKAIGGALHWRTPGNYTSAGGWGTRTHSPGCRTWRVEEKGKVVS